MPRDPDELCAEIRAHHRRRAFAMDQRKRADQSLLSFLRVQGGWRKDGEATVNAAAALAAKAMVDTAERLLASEASQKRQRIKPLLTPEYEEWRTLIEGTVAARAPLDGIEAAATKEMERLAKELPVWQAFEPVRGFTPRGLAVIVGEAGNLANYPTHSKLWKRMGVAVMGAGDGLDDHRQGNPGARATAGDWIAEGYSKGRRSKLFVIGDVLIKVHGTYREVYLARKAYEIARAVDLGLTVAPSAKIPERRKAEFRSEGYIHRRAQRYMEKRLLRDLWRAWRDEGHLTAADEASSVVLSPADTDGLAETDWGEPVGSEAW